MAAWKTYVKSSGSDEKSAVETSSATGRTPIDSSRDLEAGSVNRATPQTSFCFASARAMGNAILPFAPVIKIFWPSSNPFTSSRS